MAHLKKHVYLPDRAYYSNRMLCTPEHFKYDRPQDMKF